MRTAGFCLVLFATLAIVGCSTQHVEEGFDLSDGATGYTFRCPGAWANCYKSANKACGSKGFEEVDRSSAGSITSSGRMHDPVNAHSQGSGVYKEDVRQDDYDRVLTVRCK